MATDPARSGRRRAAEKPMLRHEQAVAYTARPFVVTIRFNVSCPFTMQTKRFSPACRLAGRHPTPGCSARRVLAHIGLACSVAALACLSSACAPIDTIDYYWQSVAGQWDLLSRARPLQDVISRSDDEALKSRLERIVAIRAFASRELGLPANGSYTRYTDIGRPFVTWAVFATPPLSLAPRQWCFPIAGCVGYRGYFNEAGAKAEARSLESEGDDVYVGHVPAYSTLGYFDDPILSSFVRWPETEVARLIFHELAHQRLYVPGDTTFNESYAVTVEQAGLERWLAHEHDPKLDAEHDRIERVRSTFNALVAHARERLATVYASNASPAQKSAEKSRAFADLERAYESATTRDPDLRAYRAWFAGQPNNAQLAAVAFYTDRVPAFQAILHEEGDRLPRFYARVDALARLPKAERDRILDAYGRRAPETSAKASRAAGSRA